MDKLRITGPSRLLGEVQISKAKNAYLPILTAVLLTPHAVKLREIPRLRDIDTAFKLLENLGVKISGKDRPETCFDAAKISSLEATYDLVKTMRASILVLGPLLARFKKAKVSLPGGCAIGARPIDIHLVNLEKMGAKIDLTGGYVEATTSGLKGAKLVLSFPSVGATENLMMAAVLAEGETVIENAALEPEIDDLGNFLISMGAKIVGLGSKIIRITGVKTLRPTTYMAIGDRIEASTYLMAALVGEGDVFIRGINPVFLESVISLLIDAGANIESGPDWIHVMPSDLKAIKIDTAPFPGFPTDVQAQLTALCTQIKGTSIITEHIFENRFMHVPELARLGARIELKGNSAIIEGPASLVGAPVMCTDLRASAALIIAAIAAHGTTDIQRVYHLDRGYENLDGKLRALGVNVERVK
ncbi:MAG: UDP-N-acetylglucosamine 1-carboxyvinyltransferase [Bdellovibrionota bacterium]